MPASLPPQAMRKQAELAPRLLSELESAVDRGRPLDRSLAQVYRRHREFGSRDRRFFSALAFAWFRWRGWLPNPQAPDASNCALAWLLDTTDAHPAIELLAASLPPPPFPWPALGGAPLADKARLLGQWLRRPPPAIDALAPAWFGEALFHPEGLDCDAHRHRCLQSFQVRPPTWLRIRPGRTAEILARLNQSLIAPKQDGLIPYCRAGTPAGLPADPGMGSAGNPAVAGPARPTNNKFISDQTSAATIHPRLPQAARLSDARDLETLANTPDVEIQDLASQCVGLVCAPQPGERWWDVCAGSGGKSFHLADLMSGQGSVLATDPRENSLREMRRRMIRNKARGITVRAWNGENASAPDGRFDGALVDAPCSGLGTWHRNPDARWRTPPDAVARQAELQSRLLRLAAERVRPGGRLVYSVCTLTAAETEAVIAAFLSERRDFRPDPSCHPLTGDPAPGPIWVWPWQGDCNGMFIARLKKPHHP